MSVAAALRTFKQEIGSRWEASVLDDAPALSRLPRASLIDHLPEFLEGLAAWVEGNRADAELGFTRLAEGHALQRHSAGIPLEALTAEYATLRRTILETLLERTPAGELVASLVVVDAGIDRAVHEAIKRYAKARDHVRERFIGILGHDLRDPLTAVMMSATLLSAMIPAEDRQAKLVAKISRSAERIERMIDDVLDFARGRLSGEIPITPTLVDLAELCCGVVDEARALAPGREIELETHGDLRGMLDRDRVSQALGNLISNARHYGTGPVVVRAWERDDRHAIFTSVTNQGTAIPQDVIARIFDPFARATTARRSGLGLGLYIVDQIALAHGGKCTARSSAATGTTFTIEWPRVPFDEVPDRPTG